MNELKEWQGVDISHIDFTYPHKTQCPKCASEGMDKSHDNLHIYGLDDDGSSLGAYCFDEDTEIFTYNGIKKIKDLIGKRTIIVNGNAEWEEVVFRSYGFDEIYELEISSNMIKKTIKTTANHLWFVKNNEKCLRTDELKPRQYLIGGELPKKSFNLIKDAVAHGFVFGDGSLHWRGNSSIVPFYSKTKYAVYDYLKDADCVITVGVRKHDKGIFPNLTFRHDKYPFKSLPLLTESDDYLFSWLSGYFAADGCLHGTGSSILNSANKEHLEFVEKVCARLGIRTRKIKSQTRAEGKTLLRKGESTIYNIRFYTKDLPENFFIREAHKKPNVKFDRKAWKVLSVKKTGVIKEVYCCETSTQSFLLADYILTHNCFACQFTVPSEEFLAEASNNSFNTVKEIEYMTTEFKMSFWDTIKDDCSLDGKGFRGIPKEVYTKYKVYHEFDENSGEVTKQHYPITKNNEVVGIKTRLVPKDFRSIGETGKNCQLFGTNSFKSSSKRAICIASGECDAMAAYAMFLENSKSRGYDPIPVVSGTIGENCATQLRNNYEWLNSFEKIYLIPDNDEAGKKVIPNLVDALPKGKVYIIELTSEKDSNDMLVKGKQKEFMNKFFEAKLYTPTGIVSSESVYDEIVKRAETDKLPFPPEFEKLNKALAGGIPFGFIVNILAGSGIGKSSFLNQVTTYYTKVCNERVGVVTLEADAGAYGENLLSYYCKRKISLIENRDEKIEFLKSDYVKKCAKDLFIREDGTPSFYLLDDRGDFDKLQDKIEELIIGFGVRVILIDVISDVFSGMSLEQVDKWMQWEKNLVKRFNCIIIQVAHVRKAGSGQKSASEGAKLTEEQLIGSGTQYRSAGINLALVRDKNAEDETVRNTTEVYLLKSRDTGITGKIMELYYDIDTHSLDDKDEYFKKKAESVVENLNISDNVEW